MALVSEKQASRKRKRRRTVKRIPLHEKVEVRSEEEGFLGSWHSGSISACKANGWFVRYYVKYDDILADDGSDNFVDQIRVSLCEQDTCTVSEYQGKYRGCIRPKPPPVVFGQCDLFYGICVDVYHKDCWWEGVIFDHEDGSEQRKVFFPDLGDEMTITFDMVRITQDWDEVTDTWRRRGTWVFLELIEEYEKENYVPVSVKQLWYDLREKDGFQKLGEWTSPRKALWKELVLEAIDDNLRLVIDHFLQTRGCCDEGEQHLKFARLVDDSHVNSRKYLTETHLIVPIENKIYNDVPSYKETADAPCMENEYGNEQAVSGSPVHVSSINCLPNSNISCCDTAVCSPSKDFCTSPNLDGIHVACAAVHVDRCSASNFENKYEKRSSLSNRAVWKPAGPDMVSGAEFCPEAITEYAQTRKKKDLKDVRKHLLHLKWTIEFMNDKQRGSTFMRFRYTSPQGKLFYSLCEVCKYLISHDEKSSLPSSFSDSLSPLIVEPFGSKESNSVSPADSDILMVESEYSPQAAADWYNHGLQKRFCRKDKEADVAGMISRAKKHLSALGWKFKFIWRNGRRVLWYFSPNNRCFNSLRKACKASMSGGLSGSTVTTQRHTKRGTFFSACSERELPQSKRYTRESSLLLKRLAKLRKINIQGIKKFQKKRKDNLCAGSRFLQSKNCLTCQSSCFSNMRYRSCGRLVDLKNRKLHRQLTRALRSTKRVQEIKTPNPSHHNARTLLSWLIDNNVVLPMAKVHYHIKTDVKPPKKGWITRDGIKCTCCQEVFTLTRFEAHAGSKKHRPAANIILEDGRSLLDCQVQIIRNKKNNSMTGQPDRLKTACHQAENDSVCSVCHYGGELILCDQCPSSFHKNCLGMKDIPSGDWFCPSCCCRICHQNKLNKDAGCCLDDTVLSCSQCERKYHIGCLRNRREYKLEDDPKDNWFCSKKCELIFLGLHELLGKPIPVGIDNLTWTLLKPMQLDSEASNNEAFTEIHSKLNIALDVMHECFEPVKESHTRRDLVKDVIFSKGSDLNRLNFRGFYTILLEKNDETITVATVRVYGEEVAEIPLVGTRFQYRRLGMCRILMDILGKKLMDLGVQRLILPAVPSVLNAWTGSFGFSKMTEAERLKFVDYTFLDFQDTVMCHKPLVEIPCAELRPSKEILPVVSDDDGKSCDFIDLHGTLDGALQEDQVEEGVIMEQERAAYDSPCLQDTVVCHKPLVEIPCAELSPSKEILPVVSDDDDGKSCDFIDLHGTLDDASQEDQVEEGIVMEQEQVDSAGINGTGSEGPGNPANNPGESECEPSCTGEIGTGDLVKEDSSFKKERKDDGILKCYKRRRC